MCVLTCEKNLFALRLIKSTQFIGLILKSESERREWREKKKHRGDWKLLPRQFVIFIYILRRLNVKESSRASLFSHEIKTFIAFFSESSSSVNIFLYFLIRLSLQYFTYKWWCLECVGGARKRCIQLSIEYNAEGLIHFFCCPDAALVEEKERKVPNKIIPSAQ